MTKPNSIARWTADGGIEIWRATTQPAISVDTSTIEEIEERVEAARRSGKPLERTWTPLDVEEEFLRHGDQAAIELLRFAKEHGADGQFVSRGMKQRAAFGFYIRGRKKDGSSRRLMLISHSLGGSVWIGKKVMEDLCSEHAVQEFVDRLKSLFGDSIDVELKEPYVPMAHVQDRMREFQDLLSWVRDRAEERLAEEPAPPTIDTIP